jgi:hypothetical protein
MRRFDPSRKTKNEAGRQNCRHIQRISRQKPQVFQFIHPNEGALWLSAAGETGKIPAMNPKLLAFLLGFSCRKEKAACTSFKRHASGTTKTVKPARNFKITRKTSLSAQPRLVAPRNTSKDVAARSSDVAVKNNEQHERVLLWRTKKKAKSRMINKAEKAAKRAATRARPAVVGVNFFTLASMTERATTSRWAGLISRAGSAAR